MKTTLLIICLLISFSALAQRDMGFGVSLGVPAGVFQGQGENVFSTGLAGKLHFAFLPSWRMFVENKIIFAKDFFTANQDFTNLSQLGVQVFPIPVLPAYIALRFGLSFLSDTYSLPFGASLGLELPIGEHFFISPEATFDAIPFNDGEDGYQLMGATVYLGWSF